MKRLVIATLLLLLVIAGCVFNFYYLGQTVDELTIFVDKADDAARRGDLTSAENLVNESFSLWQKKESFLGALLRHQEMDDIQNLYIRTLQNAENGDSKEFLVQSRELQSMLEHLVKMETANIKNVF